MTDLTRSLLTDEYLRLRHADLRVAPYDEVKHGDLYYRVLGIASLVLAAFSILIIPGLIALALGHYVLYTTEKDLPRTDITRGYATAGIVVAYASFAVMLFVGVLPHLI